MEDHKGSGEIHQKRYAQDHGNDEGEQGRELQVAIVSCLSPQEEDQKREDQCHEEQKVDKIEDDLHFVEVEFSLGRHGQLIKLQLSVIEGIQVVDEDIVIGADQCSGVVLIQSLDPRDVVVVEQSDVQPENHGS